MKEMHNFFWLKIKRVGFVFLMLLNFLIKKNYIKPIDPI
jgi:hypothetical protein